MSTTIDLRIISGKGLRCFNFFQKLSVYAFAALGSGDGDRSRRLQPHKTPVDRSGGRNPEWHHDVRFDLAPVPEPDRRGLFLEIDLLADGLLGDRLLGEVRVPFTDLAADSGGALCFVSYQIRSPKGKPSGVLNFSYRVSDGKGKIANYPAVDTSPAVIFPPTLGVPAAATAVGSCGYWTGGGVGCDLRGCATVEYPTVELPQPYSGDTWTAGFSWTASDSRYARF